MSFPEQRWDRRYLAYCLATGARSPTEALQRDAKEWRYGQPTPFMSWMMERKRAWEAETGRQPGMPLYPEDELSFDRFIGARGPGSEDAAE